MDSRKVTLVATILAIALLAVGIGYAYTATTTNSGNTATSEYITIVQGGTGNYQFTANDKVYWDTDDKKLTAATTYSNRQLAVGTLATVFTLTSSSTDGQIISNFNPGDGSTYTVAKVGNDFTLNFAPQAGGSPIANLKCAVTSTATGGFPVPPTGVSLFLKITTNNTDTFMMLTAANTFNTYADSEWGGDAEFNVASSAGAYLPATVQVYYGYVNVASPGVSGIGVSHTSGQTPTTGVPSATPVSGANLVFTVDTGTTN